MTRALGIAAMWLTLIALPWWLPMIGSYTALGSKVLIYAIATMGLNLLIGFTGGLSFGQAAYFGLGAYGAGMTLKIHRAEHAAGHRGRYAGRRYRSDLARAAGDAAARDLFRDDHDRDRAAILLRHRPLERCNRWRGRALRVQSPGYPLWRSCDSAQLDKLLLSRPVLLYDCGRHYVDAAAIAARAHLGRNPGEPQARRVHGRSRRALCVGGIRHRRVRYRASPAR